MEIVFSACSVEVLKSENFVVVLCFDAGLDFQIV